MCSYFQPSLQIIIQSFCSLFKSLSTLAKFKGLPNLSSCPESPFCLRVLSEADTSIVFAPRSILFCSNFYCVRTPPRPDLALQSSEPLDGVPWPSCTIISHPFLMCQHCILEPQGNSATPDVPPKDSCTSDAVDLGTEQQDR